MAVVDKKCFNISLHIFQFFVHYFDLPILQFSITLLCKKRVGNKIFPNAFYIFHNSNSWTPHSTRAILLCSVGNFHPKKLPPPIGKILDQPLCIEMKNDSFA